MKWVAVSGSWRTTNFQVKQEVEDQVGQIIESGNGIVTGGALGVDFIATNQSILIKPDCSHVKIILPTPLKNYAKHYLKRASEGVIARGQADSLIDQLQLVKTRKPNNFIELAYKQVNQETYYLRNSQVIAASDKLIAFQVNQSQGTQDTIDKAKSKGIPVEIHSYQIQPLEQIH